MLTLHEFQKQFTEALLNKSDTILTAINSTPKLSAHDKLAIYRNSITGALQKNLIDIYSVCYKLVGKEFFITMINEYITETLSTSPDLGEYGKYLPEFIKHFTNIHTPPYLADIAQLEWAYHKIFNAPDYFTLNIDKLNAASETAGEQIVFSLPPQSFLLKSSYPLLRIWKTNQPSYSDDETIILEKNVLYYFFIWRDGLETRIDEITHMEWQVLTWIQSGMAIGEICKQANDTISDENIISTLTTCMQNHWLVDFKI